MAGVNVSLWASGTLAPGQSVTWFWDIAVGDYNKFLRRVRTYSAVPFLPAPNPGGALPLPPNPPYPAYEQRIAVVEVFHLVKATPPVPAGVYPDGPQLQINVVISNLMAQHPVTYQIYISETDN
jgi:hypothetical protein